MLFDRKLRGGFGRFVGFWGLNGVFCDFFVKIRGDFLFSAGNFVNYELRITNLMGGMFFGVLVLGKFSNHGLRGFH